LAQEGAGEARPLYTRIPLGILSVALSGLIVFTITTYYTDFYKQPSLHISLIPSYDKKNKANTYDVLLSNDGRISATHVRLTLNTNFNLSDLTETVPLENVTHSREGPFHIIEVPRLAPGTKLILRSLPAPGGTATDYNIYATFDQGSLTKFFNIDPNTNVVSEKYTSSPLDSISSVTSISTIFTLFLAIAGVIVFFLKKRYSQNELRYTSPVTRWKTEHIPLFMETSKDPIDLPGFSFHNNSKSVTEVIASVPRVSIGIFGESGSGKTTLMHCIEGDLKPIVFDWDSVPGKDEGRLINYVRTNFKDLSWVNESSSIKKKDAGRTIEISGAKVIGIRLDEKRTKASVICENINYYEFLVQNQTIRENDILTVWFDVYEFERDIRSCLEILLTLIYESISDHPIYLDLQFLLSKYSNPTANKKREEEGIQTINRSHFVDASNKIQDEMHKIITDYPIARIVIFIENLEKCSTERITELLDLIKLYSLNEGFVFIVSITPEPFSKLFNNYLGSELSFEKYIRDIIQIPITIPKWKSSDIENLINKLLTDQKVSAIQKIIYENKFLIIEGVEHNPLKVKRFLNDFIIATKISSYRRDADIQLILFMEILKARWPNFYNDIVNENVDEFMSGLLRIADRPTEEERIKQIDLERGIRPSSHIAILKRHYKDTELWTFLRKYVGLFMMPNKSFSKEDL